MLIEQLAEEIRQALTNHRCHHKTCDCYKARELLDLLEALANVKYPWTPDLLVRPEFRW